MKQQQVSVKFSTPRYRALCYYLEKEGKNIEGELQKKLEEMYRDQVPKDVQEYVKAQNPERPSALGNGTSLRASSEAHLRCSCLPSRGSNRVHDSEE